MPNPSLDNFRGKNILVTGASRGLGMTLAGSFWGHGANLYLVARSSERLRAVRDELLQTASPGQELHYLPADLSLPNVAARIIEETRQHWNRLDVLVNNAARVGPIGTIWETDWVQWENTFRVDLLAPAELCRLAIPWMREHGGGSIINLSGGGATGPRPNFSAYGTAKAALVRLSEILAHEAEPFGVRVNCVAPGAMNTEMNDAVLRAGAERAGVEEFNRASRQAQAGGVSPSLAAELILFLASPAAAGITGRLISAQWDPWKELSSHAAELQASDIYTLRRIVPEDRGKKWP